MGLSLLALAAPLLAALQLAAPGDMPDDASYLALKEFTSPVSGQKFSAYVLKQDVAAQSFDYDNCPHPPVNTLAYTLVIDPVTGYVAHPANFNQPCGLDATAVKRVLGDPKFKRSTPDGMPWAGAYPWEKFENAAKLAEAQHKTSAEIGGFWIYAAWSVRLDVVSGKNEFDSEVVRLMHELPSSPPDPAELYMPYELQLAHFWEAQNKHGLLTDVPAADLDLALAWVYRSRGELVAAKKWLQSAGTAGALSPKAELLQKYLASSIELERNYIMAALPWFQRAWDASEYAVADEGRAAFLLAEIYRRIGDRASAKRWYEQAQAVNRGGISPALIKQQLQLVDGGKGY